MNTKRFNEITDADAVAGDEKLLGVTSEGSDVLIPLADLLALIKTPDDANYRFKDPSTFQLLNTSSGQYHSIWIENDAAGNPDLKWAENGDD